jgi:hypothetical protein
VSSDAPFPLLVETESDIKVAVRFVRRSLCSPIPRGGAAIAHALLPFAFIHGS